MDAEASSKNLLQRFAGATTISVHRPPPSQASAGDDVELSLTLSLGGSFGSNKLVRSSSISSFPLFDSIKEENDSLHVGPTTHLHRTCSLPVPVAGNDEEDYRKRKELQSQKRLEVKRMRSEKRKGPKNEDLGSCLLGTVSQAGGPRLPPSLQSIGSVGSSSSIGSSMLAKFSNSLAGKSSSIPSEALPNEANQRTSPAEKNDPRNIERKSSGMNEMERSVMEEMPCVSTRGLGPNGKKVDGFLYKYRKGEEVRIVCVCHGSFLTPAEFVMHAGGGVVDHPLRHIVVSASPSPFL